MAGDHCPDRVVSLRDSAVCGAALFPWRRESGIGARDYRIAVTVLDVPLRDRGWVFAAILTARPRASRRRIRVPITGPPLFPNGNDGPGVRYRSAYVVAGLRLPG